MKTVEDFRRMVAVCNRDGVLGYCVPLSLDGVPSVGVIEIDDEKTIERLESFGFTYNDKHHIYAIGCTRQDKMGMIEQMCNYLMNAVACGITPFYYSGHRGESLIDKEFEDAWPDHKEGIQIEQYYREYERISYYYARRNEIDDLLRLLDVCLGAERSSGIVEYVLDGLKFIALDDALGDYRERIVEELKNRHSELDDSYSNKCIGRTLESIYYRLEARALIYGQRSA